MRLLGHESGVERPLCAKRRIEKFQPSVRAEDRNALFQCVESFALDTDQSVVTGFEVEPLGDVIEEIGQAAGIFRTWPGLILSGSVS